MTDKLYYIDSHIYSFDANVISCCNAENDLYVITLDRTAFFPEGGGQYSDKGLIADAVVSTVLEKGGEILHYVNKPLEVGTCVHCELDVRDRFRKMQNHTGEHIVSGLIHKHLGFNNVGFHLGNDDVTIDIDGTVTRETLCDIERMANEAIYKNIDVVAEFPSSERLQTIEYRSKLELTENVRIVTIEGYDTCACCAPHVKKTGEIGIIKFLDFSKYKGGMRIHMLCGYDALLDYERKRNICSKTGQLFSSKEHEIIAFAEKLLNSVSDYKKEIFDLKNQILEQKIGNIKPTDGNLILFEDVDDELARKAANKLANMCKGIAGIFYEDKGKYRYVLASNSVDLKSVASKINISICGKGGGQKTMISGTCTATKAQIINYFENEEF